MIDMKKDKFRLSHSLLSLWGQGLIEDAINTYFHLNSKDNPRMAQGRELHQKWADTIKKNKVLNLGRSTFKFNTPKVEFGENGELNKPYNELWDIGGRFDCVDGDTLYEFKSGVKNSLDYAGEYQIPFYFLLAELAEIPLTKAYLIHWNQYLDKTDFVIVWNDRKQIEKARNLVDSIGPQIFNYFKTN